MWDNMLVIQFGVASYRWYKPAVFAMIAVYMMTPAVVSLSKALFLSKDGFCIVILENEPYWWFFQWQLMIADLAYLKNIF